MEVFFAMKKLLLLVLFSNLILLSACDNDDDNNGENLQALRKLIAIGDSLTAGVQSNGLVIEFQENSFPFLVSLQIGNEDRFEQPLIDSPGIGINPIFGTAPLTFENGQIVVNNLNGDPLSLLLNPSLSRPYDNLGIPGAELFDVRNTTSSDTNMLFEIILRGFGTQLEQAISLDPSMIALWIGNNDVLGAVTSGGDIERITPQEEFATEFGSLIEALIDSTSAFIIVGNIPDVTEIPFSSFFNRIFRTIPALGINTPVPVLFDLNANPIIFGDGRFIPILTREIDVENLLLPAALDYLEGIGVPDEEALTELGLSPEEAEGLVSAMRLFGLNPTGIPIDEDLTLTGLEKDDIRDAVDGFNNIISDLVSEFNMDMVDLNTEYEKLNNEGIDGYTGSFVLADAVNTAFSLDGIHPNNGGHALIANFFIEAINESFDLEIIPLDTDLFRGQYAEMTTLEGTSIDSINQLQQIFKKQ